MPRISAATNAAQRENTKRAILDSLRRDPLHPRPARPDHDRRRQNAGIGRTAVYNYFADMGELLVAYALMRPNAPQRAARRPGGHRNPIDQLGYLHPPAD